MSMFYNISSNGNPFLISVLLVMLFSELIYDFLVVLSKRLTEVDVSTILTVLQSKHFWICATHAFTYVALASKISCILFLFSL